MREIRKNNLCPCKSGKNYGKCCKQKNFKWIKDAYGVFYKRINLVPEAIEILETAREQYLKVFEREPRKENDPVFLSKYLVSEEEIERQTIEAMSQSGVQPQFIYAYKKTKGLIVTEENENLLTDKDIVEWESAIDEYYKLESTTQLELTDSLLLALIQEIDSCIITLGYVLEYGRDEEATGRPSSSQHFTVDEYVLICATKSIKTLRAIKILFKEQIGADGLALSRHLFENYLHIVLAISKPEILEHLVDAQIGLKTGTHEFARHPNGRVDSRKIIRKADKVEFKGHISYYKMAESSLHQQDLFLFDYIYNFLSEHTHPSFSGFQLVVGSHGELNHLSNELQREAIYYATCFTAMILDEIRALDIISSDVKSDIATVTRRIGSLAYKFSDAAFFGEETSEAFEILRHRLSELGSFHY